MARTFLVRSLLTLLHNSICTLLWQLKERGTLLVFPLHKFYLISIDFLDQNNNYLHLPFGIRPDYRHKYSTED